MVSLHPLYLKKNSDSKSNDFLKKIKTMSDAKQALNIAIDKLSEIKRYACLMDFKMSDLNDVSFKNVLSKNSKHLLSSLWNVGKENWRAVH